jgi:PAS domain S-box-containing protein
VFAGQKLIFCVCRDTTERKADARIIKESQECLARAELIARFGNWQFDLDHNKVLTSPGARVIYGLEDRDYTIPAVQSIPLPKYREMLDKALEGLVKRQEPYNVDFEIKRQTDGKIVNIHSIAEYDPIQNAIFGIIQDNTELKRTEKSLADEIKRRSQLFEQTPVGIVIMDPKTMRFLEFNKLAYEQLGYSREEFAKLCLKDVEATETTPAQIRGYFDSIRENGKAVFGAQQRTKQGEIRDMHITVQLVSGAAPPLVQCIWQDITDRKKAEIELQKYKLMASDTRDIVLFLNRTDGRILEANTAAVNAYGYSRQELLTKTIRDLRDPDTVASVASQMQQADEKGILFETNHRRRDGSIFPVEVSSQGTVVSGQRMLISIIRDITERWQSEEAFKASEANFRHSMDESPLGIRILDAEGETTYANKAFLDLYGYSSIEEFISIPAKERYTPQSYAEYVQRKEKRERGEYVPSNYEISIVHRDGEVRYLDVIRKEVNWNNKLQYQVLYQDITARRQAEEAIKDNEERFRRVFDEAPIGMAITSSEFRFIRTNDKLAQMLGYSSEELSKLSFRDITHPDDLPRDDEQIARLRRGEIYQYVTEKRYLRKDGSVMWGHLSVSPVRDANGGVLYYVPLIIDITEQKNSEAEKQQLREKAEVSSRLAAVGEMAAGIAHEINNPLTGVIGFSEILMDRKDVPGDIKEELKIINDGSQRVKEIVKRMLTFARQTKPVKTSINVNELIEATLDLRSYVLKTANIEVIKQMDQNLPWIVADAGQLQQVFLNIIVNAEFEMKKAHDRGMLTITTRKTNGHICVTFKDDGPGMTRDVRSKIFQPFFTTKPVGQGTGMGLSLSRSIILEHGGTIEVESQPGQGAVFSITLPTALLTAERPAEATADVMVPSIIRNARILVVDDEEAIRHLVVKVLAKIGYTVDATRDAGQALAKLEKTTYDVIIMDIRMPGMSGTELYAGSKKCILNWQIR